MLIVLDLAYRDLLSVLPPARLLRPNLPPLIINPPNKRKPLGGSSFLLSI